LSFWAVAQTKPQHEHIARIWLMRSGFETYAPRIKYRSGRIMRLFPTYIFVRVIDRWYPILWSPGVLRLLMSGEQPARLPELEVLRIRRREVNGFVKLPRKGPTYGQRVRILRGSFEGRMALYEGQAAEERECVLLELLGQMVPVELPSRDVEGAQSLAS
jgi:transcription antitermination factor NusG